MTTYPPPTVGRTGDNQAHPVFLAVNDMEVSSGNPLPIAPSGGNINLDGQTRSAQTLTLFDGKILNAEDTYKWDTKGTGTATYGDNAVNLTVTTGQYLVRQSRAFTPYFAGKPQIVEGTHINFAIEAGKVKRFGYFSSNAVAPYDSSKDGFWIEADGVTDNTYKLVTSFNGTVTHSVAWTDWDDYDAISAYDWSKFTVNKADFLWLGGAGLRLFMVVNGMFRLVHTIDDHAGYASTLIFKSPNQPVRYEIRSTSGSGSFNTVCSQVSTEGATIAEAGDGVAIYTPSIACNSIGTIYALCGMRKVAAYRNHFVPVAEFGCTQTTNSADSGVLLLLINPTLSAPLTWVANSRIETAIATNQTVTDVGRILKAVPFSGSAIAAQAPNASLRVLGCGIDNTMSELVVAYAPLSTTQGVSGSMQAVEY
jgi:hypothetical protein